MKAFLPNQTRISHVHLRTANLDRERAFYTDALGLITDRDGTLIKLGEAGLHSIAFTQDPQAALKPVRSLGLYHLAIRYPGRSDLAGAYRRLIRNSVPIAGASDHGVSEAIYLQDPDGNGIELYVDRPRAEWQWQDGQVLMGTRGLNLPDLLAAKPDESEENSMPHPDIGHIHLQVADLVSAQRFYAEFLGMSVTQRSYPGALFFAAGDYHHHVAANVWGGGEPAPANSIGLVSYRFEVPCPEILYCLSHRAPLWGYESQTGLNMEGAPILQIRDPNGSWLEVQASATAEKAGRPILCEDFAEKSSNARTMPAM